MTWAKYGTEFFDQLVAANFQPDLDDAAQLTHAQALHYLYSVESMDMTFKKSTLHRFATSSMALNAATELVRTGLWEDLGMLFKVRHHEDVFRQSLASQQTKRQRDKEAQQRKRAKEASKHSVSADVSADVSGGARGDTDRQSYNQPAFDNEPAFPMANEAWGQPRNPEQVAKFFKEADAS